MQNWNLCCEVAAGIARKTGYYLSQNVRMDRNWYQWLRVKQQFWKMLQNHDSTWFLKIKKMHHILKIYCRKNQTKLGCKMLSVIQFCQSLFLRELRSTIWWGKRRFYKTISQQIWTYQDMSIYLLQLAYQLGFQYYAQKKILCRREWIKNSTKATG